MGEAYRAQREKTVYQILVGNSPEKRPLGRPRRKWENNIKINL
jgi:hypothetical protein